MANPPDRTLTTDRQAEGEASPPEGSPAPLRRAVLVTQSYAGRAEWPCIITGEVSHCFRIRVLQRTKLAGRNRWIAEGGFALVPKTAVRVL
jgi:hypothetical protein